LQNSLCCSSIFLQLSFLKPYSLRNLVAIALLLCFAIYHFGYYAFYYSYQYKMESNWNDKIYGEQIGILEERLMEIPLSAPYMANQDDFQATNTRFEKAGQYFRAIKQRYQNDTLQVVYVPDTARRVLESTVQIWISSLTEDVLPINQNGKIFIKLLVKDYLQPVCFFYSTSVKTKVCSFRTYIADLYLDPALKIDSPPPLIS